MILLVTFNVHRQGGIERLSLHVKACLEKSGISVRLVYPQSKGNGTLGRMLGRTCFFLELIWLMPMADQILSMHALLLRPIHWLSILRWRKQKIYCWMHGIEVWGEALAGVKEDLMRCTTLIASSEFTKARVLEKDGNWPPITVINPMADIVDANQIPEPLPPSIRLLTVARMDAEDRYKGHRIVLAALEELRQRNLLPVSWEWRVIGDGSDRELLQHECAGRDLGPWVRFLGSVTDTELRAELRQCSVLLMPSTYAVNTDGKACGEGFGIVYLEAAWAGRASIACRLGGQTDLIIDRKSGWLINPCAQELASLLLELARRPEQLFKAGMTAREIAIKRFSEVCFRQKLSHTLELKTTR